MALIEKDGKIINVYPPQNLTEEEKERMENAPINEELIKRATSRNFKISEPEKENTLKLEGKAFRIPCEDCAKMILSTEAVISMGKFKAHEYRCKDCVENKRKPSEELLKEGMNLDDSLTEIYSTIILKPFSFLLR